MSRTRSRVVETEMVNPRILGRRTVKRQHIDRWAVGRDELAPGVVGVTHVHPTLEQLIRDEAFGASGHGLSITLGRESDQTISVGGEAIEFTDLTVGPRDAGFDDVTLPSSAIAIPVESVVSVVVRFEWVDWRAGGTVKLKRGDVVVDESPQSWGPRFSGVFHAGSVQAGEELSVVVDHTDASTHDITDVQVAVKVEGAVGVSAAAAPEIGIYSISFLPSQDKLVASRFVSDGAGGYTETLLQSVTRATSAATWYHLRASVIGDRIRARVWDAGAAEPSTWHLDVADPSPLQAGMVGVSSTIPASTVGELFYDTLEASHDGAPSFSTNFGEYSIGGLPAGWGRVLGTSEAWNITTESGSTGQVLAFPTSAAGGSFVAWHEEGSGYDTEILCRLQTAQASNTVGVILRANSLL